MSSRNLGREEAVSIVHALFAAVLAAGSGLAGAQPASPAAPPNATAPSGAAVAAPLVFFDIASPNAAELSEFYRRVFGWSIDGSGAFSVPVTGPLQAQIRPDPVEKRLYIGVPDVAATLELIAASGGSIDAPRFEVPGVVVLGLFRDPAGNPMGLVELANGLPKVP